MTPHRAMMASKLFDHLAANPTTTLPAMKTALGCSRSTAQQALHDLRAILGEGDTINVVAQPARGGGPWLYELRAHSSPSKWWEANRIADLYTSVSTVRSVVTSMLAGLDGRTIDGRGQRLFKVALDNILSTLDAIAPD
jgi:hypothetical protein